MLARPGLDGPRCGRHLGTWLAEAEVQSEWMAAGTYEGHDIDIEALNAQFLAAMRDQPWDVAWVQANADRTRMLQAWAELPEPSDEAPSWIRKTGADHYAEHLGRLREWVDELIRACDATGGLIGPARRCDGVPG